MDLGRLSHVSVGPSIIKKCTTLRRTLITEGLSMCEGRSYWGNLCTFSSILHKPKFALKNKACFCFCFFKGQGSFLFIKNPETSLKNKSYDWPIWPTLSFCRKSVIRVSVATAALQSISAIPLDSIYMHWYMIFVFLFLTYFSLYTGSRFIHLIRTESNLFLFMAHIPLCAYTAASLSIHPSSGWAVQEGENIFIPMADSCYYMAKCQHYCRAIILQLKIN